MNTRYSSPTLKGLGVTGSALSLFTSYLKEHTYWENSCPWPLHYHWELCGVPCSDCKETWVWPWIARHPSLCTLLRQPNPVDSFFTTFRRNRPFRTQDLVCALVQALVISHLDYCYLLLANEPACNHPASAAHPECRSLADLQCTHALPETEENIVTHFDNPTISNTNTRWKGFM